MLLDFMESAAWVTSSILANMIVIGLLVAMAVMMLGVPWWFFVDGKAGKKMMTHGCILLVVMVGLAQTQLHTTPVNFEDVENLGLVTIPGGWFTDMWTGLMGFLVQASSYLGGGLVLVGFILFFTKNKSAARIMGIGVVLFIFTGLVGGGGLMEVFGWFFSRLGGLDGLNIFS